MAAKNVTVRLSVKVCKPLAMAGALMKLAGDWLISKAVRVRSEVAP